LQFIILHIEYIFGAKEIKYLIMSAQYSFGEDAAVMLAASDKQEAIIVAKDSVSENCSCNFR
jgi:hypothetical protein